MDVERCVAELRQYAVALQDLEGLLGAERWREAWHVGVCAAACLRCPRCREDEQANQWRVGGAWADADRRWYEPAHPCHGALRAALEGRLRAPGRTTWLTAAEVRFTQRSHSERFRHGEHAGLEVSAVRDVGVLDVVFFHGQHRSLNNRHATALHRSGARWAQVRVWPLVGGLQLPHGGLDVPGRFVRACSSDSDGLCIASRQQQTWVDEAVAVHVRNVDYAVDEAELLWHLRWHSSAGRWITSVQLSRRRSGQQNGWGTLRCSTRRGAEELVAATFPPLRERTPQLSLDVRSAPTAPRAQGGVLCGACLRPCAELADTRLVSAQRDPGWCRRGWQEDGEGHFCIASRWSCRVAPSSCSATLGALVCACGAGLGVLREAGCAHFRATAVALDLPGAPWLAHPSRWKSVRQCLGSPQEVLLSDVSAALLSRLLADDAVASGRRGLRLSARE